MFLNIFYVNKSSIRDAATIGFSQVKLFSFIHWKLWAIKDLQVQHLKDQIQL